MIASGVSVDLAVTYVPFRLVVRIFRL